MQTTQETLALAMARLSEDINNATDSIFNFSASLPKDLNPYTVLQAVQEVVEEHGWYAGEIKWQANDEYELNAKLLACIARTQDAYIKAYSNERKYRRNDNTSYKW